MLTQDQLEIRKQGLGGSDAPIVVGVSPFKSPFQLYMEKRGETVDQEETEEMEWGNRLEPTIAEAWSEKTGIQMRRQPTKFSKDYPWMLVNIDRQIVGDKRGPGILEIKNFGYFSEGYSKEDAEVADYVQVQCQHSMAVLGYTWAAYAVLVGGQRFYHGVIERNKEDIDFIIDAEEQFWKMVKEGIQPDIDGSPRTTTYLKHLYQQDSGTTITGQDPVLIDRARDLVEIQKDLKAKEMLEDQHKNFFKVYMRDNQVLQLPTWGELRWKKTKPKPKTIFDEETFKADHPDIHKQYSKKITPSGDRRFTIHPDKATKEEDE